MFSKVATHCTLIAAACLCLPAKAQVPQSCFDYATRKALGTQNGNRVNNMSQLVEKEVFTKNMRVDTIVSCVDNARSQSLTGLKFRLIDNETGNKLPIGEVGLIKDQVCTYTKIDAAAGEFVDEISV